MREIVSETRPWWQRNGYIIRWGLMPRLRQHIAPPALDAFGGCAQQLEIALGKTIEAWQIHLLWQVLMVCIGLSLNHTICIKVVRYQASPVGIGCLL